MKYSEIHKIWENFISGDAIVYNLKKVKLTPKEADTIEWALDIMEEMSWTRELGYGEDALPHIEGNVFVPKQSEEIEEILEDFEVRLTEQLVSMAREEFEGARLSGELRVIRSAFKKIKKAYGVE